MHQRARQKVSNGITCSLYCNTESVTDTELFAFEDLNLSNISEDDDDDDGEADDPFVDNLIFQLEDLRDKVNYGKLTVLGTSELSFCSG